MNYIEAEDLVLASVKVTTDAQSVPCVYSDISSERPTAPLWCRVGVKWANRGVRGFGGLGLRKHRTTGVLCVEIYANSGDGGLAGMTFATNVVTNLENIRLSNVRYRNIRIVHAGADGPFSHCNVLATVEFDDNH